MWHVLWATLTPELCSFPSTTCTGTAPDNFISYVWVFGNPSCPSGDVLEQRNGSVVAKQRHPERIPLKAAVDLRPELQIATSTGRCWRRRFCRNTSAHHGGHVSWLHLKCHPVGLMVLRLVPSLHPPRAMQFQCCRGCREGLITRDLFNLRSSRGVAFNIAADHVSSIHLVLEKPDVSFSISIRSRAVKPGKGPGRGPTPDPGRRAGLHAKAPGRPALLPMQQATEKFSSKITSEITTIRRESNANGLQ